MVRENTNVEIASESLMVKPVESLVESQIRTPFKMWYNWHSGILVNITDIPCKFQTSLVDVAHEELIAARKHFS